MAVEKLMLPGIILIIIGAIILIITSILLAKQSGNVDIGFGGFIGSIPFGFFTSKKMFWIWPVILMLVVGIWFFLRRFVG